MRKMGTLLWIMAVLFATFLGFSLRYTNDQKNQSIIILNDFDEILSLQDKLKKDCANILEEQKKVGISYTLISKEQLTKNSEVLKKANFNPILKLKGGRVEDYEDTIKQFNIKYVFFDGRKVLGYPFNIQKTASMIKNNNLIFMVEEKLSQIGIQDKKGLLNLIEDTDYSINRMARLSKTQIKETNSKDLFYKLVRSVVDRNIRFVFIEQIKNPKFSISENYEETNKAVGDFSQFIKRMNYKLDGDIVKLSNQRPSLNYYFFVTLGLAATLLVYVKRLFVVDKKWSFIYYFVMVSFIMFVSKFGKIEIMLALLSSIVYASLASLLVLNKCSSEGNRVLLKSVATFFGVNLLGGYTVVSCLGSLNYTMSLEVFRGVKLAFVLPIIMYTISYIILYNIKLKDIVSYVKKKSTSAILLTLAGAMFVVLIYILRSGNFGLFKTTTIELKMREILEYVFGVRPRIKEFLIGYPAIMLLVHYRKVPNKILRFVLGIGVTIGSISVINSFCHVFTAINISIIRSVNGLILGLLVGKCGIAVIDSISFRVFLQNNRLVKKIITLYNEKV